MLIFAYGGNTILNRYFLALMVKLRQRVKMASTGYETNNMLEQYRCSRNQR